MKQAAPRTNRSPAKAKRANSRSTGRAINMAALQASLEKLERKVRALELRDQALDHSIEELAAAWAAEQ